MRRTIKQICILLCLIVVAPIYAEDFMLLKNTENKFNQDGLNLKGDVFSVVTQEVSTKKEFGEIIPTSYYTTDSIFFDSEGRIIEKYINSNNRELYEYDGDDIFVIKQSLERDKWVLCDSIKYQRLRDDKGRLVQETVYKNGEPISRISFNFTPTGYKVEYFPNISGSAEKYELKNNTIIQKTIFGPETFKFDNDEKIIRYTGSAMKVNRINIWEYNENGDLVLEHKKADAPWPGMGKTTYAYEYDDSGNWVTKKWDNKWYVRKIIYKTPEERKAFEVQQLAREKAIRDSLIALSVSELDKKCEALLNQCLAKRRSDAYSAASRAGYRFGDAVDSNQNAIKSLETNDAGKYTITMASGNVLSDLHFSCSDDEYNYNGSFITNDGKTAIIVNEIKYIDSFGPFLIYVVNFKSGIEKAQHEINSWAESQKIDYDKLIEMVGTSSLYWPTDEIENQILRMDNEVKEINYVPFDIVAEMVFPSEIVEQHFQDIREVSRKHNDYILISRALKHIGFDEKMKPIATKLKKWEYIGDATCKFTLGSKRAPLTQVFNPIKLDDIPELNSSEIYHKTHCTLAAISNDKKFVWFPVGQLSAKPKIMNFLVELDEMGKFVECYYFEEKINR